jgi:hypothetical protein
LGRFYFRPRFSSLERCAERAADSEPLVDLASDPDWLLTYDTSAAANQKGRLASVTNGVVTTELT